MGKCKGKVAEGFKLLVLLSFQRQCLPETSAAQIRSVKPKILGDGLAVKLFGGGIPHPLFMKGLPLYAVDRAPAASWLLELT